MAYKIIKLDKRHSWHSTYQYMIEFSKGYWSGTGVLHFDRARRWFNATYGWSQDVETRFRLVQESVRPFVGVTDQDINDHWAYSVQYKEYRIYVASDSELSLFLLAHPQE